jgi:hypothetical protein
MQKRANADAFALQRGASDFGEKRRLRPEGVYIYVEREQTAVEKIRNKKKKSEGFQP